MPDLPIIHYLVQRGPDGLERIDVYRDGEVAVAAYGQRERDLAGRPLAALFDSTREGPWVRHSDVEVCLFGATSLLELCRTHASWLAPETIDPHGLLDRAPRPKEK